MFTRVIAKPKGAGRIGSVYAIPRQLVAAFGNGGEPSEDGKVSRRYIFRPRGSDEHVTIYDYKRTRLYSPRLPAPSTFWSGWDMVSLSLGGKLATALQEPFQTFLRENGVNLAIVRYDERDNPPLVSEEECEIVKRLRAEGFPTGVV